MKHLRKSWNKTPKVVVPLILAAVMAVALFAVPAVAIAPSVTVSVDAPAEAAHCTTFTAWLNITYVEDFTAATVTVTYDPTVLDLIDVSDGEIGDNSLGVEYEWVPTGQEDSGEIIVIIWGDVPGFTGEGYLMDLEFHVIGEPCNTSLIDIDGVMSDDDENEILATWVDGSVHVCEPRVVVSGKPLDVGAGPVDGWIPPGPPPGFEECDQFKGCEWIYVWGYGFQHCQWYRIWIQPYGPSDFYPAGPSVVEGQMLDPALCPPGFDPFNPQPGMIVEVHIDEDGKFGPVPVWHVPEDPALICTLWEIVADKMNVPMAKTLYNEGFYNEAEDGLDAAALGEYGFHIYPEGLTIVLLSLGLAAVVGYLVVRRRKGAETDS